MDHSSIAPCFAATVVVMGIDIGKNSFHVIGLDARGAIALQLKWSRGQVETRLANMPPCLIEMEACVGAHHLSRRLKTLGHDARLMPAKYVRPYSKGQKNDFRDGEAIAEAVQRPTMKFIATKTAEQLDLQALHRVREQPVSQRTGIINQIRAFCWSAALPCVRGCASSEPGFRKSSLHAPTSCRRAWCTFRGSGRRLAPARRAHRRSVRRHRNAGPARSSLPAVNDSARHRSDHLQRDGGCNRPRRSVLEGAPGLALLPSRHRPETAPSWAGYRSVAIATCAFCSCRRPGFF
jgi:transposase